MSTRRLARQSSAALPYGVVPADARPCHLQPPDVRPRLRSQCGEKRPSPDCNGSRARRPSPNGKTMRKTIVGLDAMRFVLAVYLMVFHTISAYPQANRHPLIWLADLGGFSTSSFFILSGFILTYVYVDRSAGVR